jgi:lipopolysaccharide export system protein LptA
MEERPASWGSWRSWIAVLAVGIIWVMGWQPTWAQTQPSGRALTITADLQEANANTGIIVASGNVLITYPAEEVVARSQKATYFTKEQRIVLEGGVNITQKQNQLQADKVTYMVQDGTIQAIPVAGQQVETIYLLPEPASPAPTLSATP